MPQLKSFILGWCEDLKYSVCLLVALAGVALAYPTKERRPPPAKNGDDLIKRLEEVLDDIEFDKEYDGFEI